MTTIQKIIKKGFRVTSNIGWIGGEQRTISYTATSNATGRKINARTKTELLKKLQTPRGYKQIN